MLLAITVLLNDFFLLHVHTYVCLLKNQLVSLSSVVCFSLLMFWACLISAFSCCVTCRLSTLNKPFFLHVLTYDCPLEHQLVSLFSVVCTFDCFSHLMFWACLISPFSCCVTCHHCALKRLFFPACTYL